MSLHDPFEPSATPSASLRALAARGDVRRYRKGTLLIEEGDRGDNLYIILRGEVRVFCTSGESQREVTLGYYGPGEYVGEMSIDGGPRSASVMVVQPATCSVLSRAMIELHIAQDPKFAFELMAKLVRRVRTATAHAKELSLNSAYGRLAKLLNQLAVAGPAGTRIVNEHCTHQELADQIGCSRAMVTRLMKDLSMNGCVEPAGRGIRLLRELPPKW